MKKLAYFFVFCLIVYAFGACESDSRIVTTDDYAAVQKGGPEATAKCECLGPETAWSQGPRFVAQGSWAMYTPYCGESKFAKIIAGQYMEMGEVWFERVDATHVRIYISTYETFGLMAGPEPIKINVYMSTPPAVNPKVGLFPYKYTPTTWRDFMWNEIGTFLVNSSGCTYFAIHLDVDCV